MPEEASTRERLVRAAAELFWDQGYAKTGVKEVLRKSGATSGSLYHFFQSKEHMLQAVLEFHQETLRSEILGAAAASTEDPFERVFAVLGFYRRHLLENDFARGCPIGNLAAELCDTYPQIRKKVSEVFAEWSGGIESFLADAGRRFPAGVSHAALAQFVLTVMEGAVLQARTHRDIAPFDASVAQLRAYFEFLGGEAGRSSQLEDSGERARCATREA